MNIRLDQQWSWFHHRLNTKNGNAHSAHSHSPSQLRERLGVARVATTKAKLSSAAKYFDSSARPSNTPEAANQRQAPAPVATVELPYF